MKYILAVLISFTVFTSKLSAATECDFIQNGDFFGTQAVYSNCAVTYLAQFSYIFMNTDGANISASGLDATQGAFFMPPASPAVDTGASSATFTVGLLDKGPGYSGECTMVTVADPDTVPAIPNNVYCMIFDSEVGPKVYIRSTWTGAAFTNSTIGYGPPGGLPVELQSFEIE
jgi:hypothetical protein